MLGTFCCVALMVGQPAEKPVVAPSILEKHWSELADRNKNTAALAMLALATSPRVITAFLKERIRPVSIDAKNVAKWLTELVSDNHHKQIQAIENLEYCGKYI